MNKKLAITILLLSLLCLGLMSQVFAQTLAPGVSEGEYFNYNVVTHWSTDNASATVPVGLQEFNDTTHYKVEISFVSGVNATATYVWDFANGTETPFLLTQDVESGQSYYQSYNVPPLEILVGANITAGELLHPTGNDTFTVNQTITRNYASGARPTNLIETSFPIQNNATDNTTVGTSTTKFYIDKATGVIVEQESQITHFADPAETASIMWTLEATNAWNASAAGSFPLPMILAIVAAIVVVGILVAVYALRRKGHRRKFR